MSQIAQNIHGVILIWSLLRSVCARNAYHGPAICFASSTMCMVITSLQPGIAPSPQAKSNMFFPMFILWDKCTGSFLLAKQILSCGCVQSTSYKLHRYACNRNQSPYPVLHKESATRLLSSPSIISEFYCLGWQGLIESQLLAKQWVKGKKKARSIGH